MKMPKSINDYCKKCNTHTEHKLKDFKTRPARAMAKGTRANVRAKKGYGGKYQFTATVKKQNKRAVMVAECSVCKAKHYYIIPKRQKKVEIVTA